MTGLVANIASLAATFRTVAREVSRFVAGVAALHREAARVVSTLRATAGDVSGFVTVVTVHLRPLYKQLGLDTLIRALTLGTVLDFSSSSRNQPVDSLLQCVQCRCSGSKDPGLPCIRAQSARIGYT